MPIAKYHVKLQTTTEMLGTAPSNPQIYADHILTAKNRDAIKLAESKADDETVKALKQEELERSVEELALLPETEQKGITVFRRKDGQVCLPDFMLRGFIKESAEACTGTWGLRSKIDKWCFVTPRIILIKRDGKPITEVDGKLERPLRCETMRGPRVSLACSEMINEGVTLEFDISVLPLGQAANALGKEKGAIDATHLKEWLEYGELNGLGQWRTGSHGRFTFELTALN